MAGAITTAGEFVIDLAEIITVDGSIQKLTNKVVNVTIFEDIENPYLTGNISFMDDHNVQNLLPLIGQELLKLKIRTPSMKDSREIIESLFYIKSLASSLEVNANKKIISFEFISLEGMENRRKTMHRTLTGSFSSMVETILRTDLKSTKDFFVDPTVGIKKIVATDISPIFLINSFVEQAVSEKFGSPSYMFFETLEGFHFRSLESLYKEDTVMDYTADSEAGFTERKKGYSDVLTELNKIRKSSLNNSNDSLSDSISGAYGSKVITHDIFNKTYSQTSYNYFESFEKEKHINYFADNGESRGKQSPIFSDVAIDDNKSTAADRPVKTFLRPVSFSDIASRSDAHFTNSSGTHAFSGYDPDSWITRRTSMMNNFEAIEANIVVDGHTAVRAGEMVKLTLPSNAQSKQTKENQVDRFFRGAFLIRNIQHDFTVDDKGNKHVMEMSCVADCVDEQIPSTDKNRVPKVYGKSNKQAPITINVA